MGGGQVQVRTEIQSSVPKSPTVDPRGVFFQFAQRHLMLSRGPGEESWQGALPSPERTNIRITVTCPFSPYKGLSQPPHHADK